MDNSKTDRNTIIAVCGKGGVGKTSISAMLTKIFAGNKEKKILAIDADPAIGLASALGFQTKKSVNDIRNTLIENIEQGKGGDREQIISMLDYEVFDAIEERDNLAFLAIGRPENDGCYCQVNEFLKDILRTVSSNFDYVIIDGEAGIEQVNRRVMEKVTHLLLVSDASLKGINVTKTIFQVSEDAVEYKDAGLILNRIRDKSVIGRITVPPGLKLLGWIPEEDVIHDFDIQGKSILELPECDALKALTKLVDGLYKSAE